MSMIKSYQNFNDFFKKTMEASRIARKDASVIAVSCIEKTTTKKAYRRHTFINENELCCYFDKKSKKGFIMVNGVCL